MFSDMEGAFEKLGMSFSKEELGQVFQESDMLENGRLNFKEFLVCLAIGFVLHVRCCFLDCSALYCWSHGVIVRIHRRSRRSKARS